jgi:hypothetical protein
MRRVRTSRLKHVGPVVLRAVLTADVAGACGFLRTAARLRSDLSQLHHCIIAQLASMLLQTVLAWTCWQSCMQQLLSTHQRPWRVAVADAPLEERDSGGTAACCLLSKVSAPALLGDGVLVDMQIGEGRVLVANDTCSRLE